MVIPNACPTEAILSILLNCNHPDVSLGSTLVKLQHDCPLFDTTTKGSDRGDYCEAIRMAHNSLAKPTSLKSDVECQNKDVKTRCFYSYVPVNGRVYEIDGFAAELTDLGIIPEDSDWLKVAESVIESKLNRYKRIGVKHELMAIVKNKKMISTTFSDFEAIRSSTAFIDKSLMIKAVINDAPESMLITGPRRFGKSSNLDMLMRFFDVSSKGDKFNFKSLKLGRIYPDIVNNYCGKYIVLWTDLSRFTTVIVSLDAAKVAIREILHYTYVQYQFLCSSPVLPEEDQELCKRWCSNTEFSLIDDVHVGNGFKNLASYLHAHFGKKVILCVDEFDGIVNCAMLHVESTELDNIIKYYFGLFSLLVKTDRPQPSKPLECVYKAIFTGITAITCTGPSPLNNVPPFKFMQNQLFLRFYGILVGEFEDLLEKEEFSHLKEEKLMAKWFYNGYRSEQGAEILCTNSVVRYLTSNDTTRLKSYWQISGAIQGFSKVWGREELEDILKRIVHGEEVSITDIGSIVPEHLNTLRQICDQQSEKVTPHLDVLFTYYQQMGYFAVVSRTGKFISLQVPNEEVRREFHSLYATRYLLKYRSIRSSTESIKDCARCFEELSTILQSNNPEELFANISSTLNTVCEEFLDKNTVNEATFEHLLYAILLHTQFQPKSQQPVRAGNRQTKPKVLDLCFQIYDVDFVIELKTRVGETAAGALEQIKDRRY
ncbi:uncharacterized protein LOC135844014 isoform X2 [Planococcus citri]|uniref:uncharacterized protein LOC135844014 isoform X2 n=1 Tax=Planococcus citri TaxID=170843 RepID=UPI0031F76F38